MAFESRVVQPHFKALIVCTAHISSALNPKSRNIIKRRSNAQTRH